MNQARIKSLEQAIWVQLNKGEWPEVLAEIKPKQWDGTDLNGKGKLVLDRLGQIIYQITLLTNKEHMQANKQHIQAEVNSLIQSVQRLPRNIKQHFTCRI